GLIQAEPIAILDRRLKKAGNAAMFVLVLWSNISEEDVTWEAIKDIQIRFPQFRLNLRTRLF
ncbi:reverse transcriptase, partial [Tanacetum coccineum]